MARAACFDAPIGSTADEPDPHLRHFWTTFSERSYELIDFLAEHHRETFADISAKLVESEIHFPGSDFSAIATAICAKLNATQTLLERELRSTEVTLRASLDSFVSSFKQESNERADEAIRRMQISLDQCRSSRGAQERKLQRQHEALRSTLRRQLNEAHAREASRLQRALDAALEHASAELKLHRQTRKQLSVARAELQSAEESRKELISSRASFVAQKEDICSRIKREMGEMRQNLLSWKHRNEQLKQALEQKEAEIGAMESEVKQCEMEKSRREEQLTLMRLRAAERQKAHDAFIKEVHQLRTQLSNGKKELEAARVKEAEARASATEKEAALELCMMMVEDWRAWSKRVQERGSSINDQIGAGLSFDPPLTKDKGRDEKKAVEEKVEQAEEVQEFKKRVAELLRMDAETVQLYSLRFIAGRLTKLVKTPAATPATSKASSAITTTPTNAVPCQEDRQKQRQQKGAKRVVKTSSAPPIMSKTPKERSVSDSPAYRFRPTPLACAKLKHAASQTVDIIPRRALTSASTQADIRPSSGQHKATNTDSCSKASLTPRERSREKLWLKKHGELTKNLARKDEILSDLQAALQRERAVANQLRRAHHERQELVSNQATDQLTRPPTAPSLDNHLARPRTAPSFRQSTRERQLTEERGMVFGDHAISLAAARRRDRRRRHERRRLPR